MKQTVFCMISIFLLMCLMGGMEYRYHIQDRKYQAEIDHYERWAVSIMEDAARMEKDIKTYRMELARKSFKMDMPTSEFLATMADYLSRDGRCRVVVEKADWSSWPGRYK